MAGTPGIEREVDMNGSLELLAVLAGVLTVLSPCILPILPALLSASVSEKNPHRPFWIVLGLGMSFALFGTVFAVFKNFLGISNGALRDAALLILLFFGLSLLMPRLWEHIGSAISTFVQRAPWMVRLSSESGPAGTILLGSALGLVWAPCAGPILGIILTLAAVQASFFGTLALMGAYALGAALPMLLIGYGGQRVAKKLAGFRGVGSNAPKVLGVVTLAAVIGLYFNFDTALLSRLPSTLFLSNAIEQKLVARTDGGGTQKPSAHPAAMSVPMASPLPVLGPMPAFSDIAGWINSPPLTREDLRGKVVLVDFWTYSCINCIRTLPYVKRWYEKYKDQGLVVIGVHTPEFAFEKDPSNVETAVKKFGIPYPVAIDSRYGTWNAYSNQYWPAHYLIDAQGRIRDEHFGEGDYQKTEREIQSLLYEAGTLKKPMSVGSPLASVNFMEIQSPETYLGFSRADRYASPERVDPGTRQRFSYPSSLSLNAWALSGTWRVEGEKVVLERPDGGIRFRFHAPKLNIVMKGTGAGVKGRVFLDGKPLPPAFFGADIASDGTVAVRKPRLYNMVSLPGNDTGDHTFEIRFSTPGASVYTFTFG